MHALVAISLLLVTEALADEHHFVSPNGEFEAYTTAANDDGTGMKLFCIARTRAMQVYFCNKTTAGSK